MGWAELENGDLLAAAEKAFDAFVTPTKTSVISKILQGGNWPFWCCQRRAGLKSKSISLRFLTLCIN
jgi:hypothetical protein